MLTTLSIDQFQLHTVARGSKQSFLLQFESNDAERGGQDERDNGIQGRIPLNLICGGKPGPTLLVLAGVHGDEYEGIQTAIELYRDLRPDHLVGTLLIVPMTNMLSYEGESRLTQQDGCNLAREFPGDPKGTVTQRLAWHVHHRLISAADFLLDLHSGGERYALPAFVGYEHNPGTVQGRASQAAAEVFGLDVLWGHEAISSGRTISSAHQLGIPWLYTEAYGGKRIIREEQQKFYWGTIRLLRHLHMLSDAYDRSIPSAPPIRHRLSGDGDFDQSVLAQVNGLFVPQKQLLDDVKRGDKIGVIYNWQGQPIQDVRSHRDGLVVMFAGVLRVKQGDHLYMIADRRDG